MVAIQMANIPRTYKNAGQHAEQVARYTLTGRVERADNKPAAAGGDCGDIQIKSARATVCKGTDIKAHLEHDGAKRYGYVTADFTMMYLMNPTEYVNFVEKFGTVTRESKQNGGAEKLRLKSEGKEMREWLTERIA